ncbi:MAG: tryptophan--tRNA ligase [Bacilli bacterium]|nr:tryptophan--tRNA ligase [Bacilli bacterium]
MKKILTGLKPTGDLTLGNYIGSIKLMKNLEGNYESYMFVADLHALTVPNDPVLLHERIRKFIGMYLACGIDPTKHTIYLQSENPYIPAISWLLECSTYYGEASRMIQFKEKSKQNANFTVGLLTYPILMAADILYCDADLVPVGIDQKQHVELARDIADRFNKKYGEAFTLPDVYINESGAKIYDLQDPTKKMSKTEENPKGVISLFDDPEVAKSKIMKATTDSLGIIKYDPLNQPGISNLLVIASVLSGTTIDSIVKDFEGKGYGDFKKYVAEIVGNFLTDIQSKYNDIMSSGKVDEILDNGKNVTTKIAKDKYEKLSKLMGVCR